MSIEKIRIGSHKELQGMLAKEIEMVEEDLTTICSNVPVKDKASLDILCHDSDGQLVILQMSVDEDDSMLLTGIQSLDYVDKFKSFLKATYDKLKINDKEKPRLIFIAPSYSDAVLHAVESMKGIRIDLYEWEYLKLGDHKGLHLQLIFSLTPDKIKRKKEKSEEKKSRKAAKKKAEDESEDSDTETGSSKEEAQSATQEENSEETTQLFEAEKEEPSRRKLKLF